jgi:8-oxo-dGTP diphosphatase
MTPIFVVAVALIDVQGRVLVQQRPAGSFMPGLWEFPGGKVETGETPEQALVREVREELGITLAQADVTPFTFASEPHSGKHLLLLLYYATRWQGEPQALHAEALQWVHPHTLRTLDMPPADIPFIDRLEQFLTLKP